ncbi:UvrD-helicase domain-containing protein [Actinokineospora sp. NBRC 105648]|uniref:UvrD-helicase domain-containing protein n=1 Tax=Actinokineospora sp. NBRC 105648 TaxID=3032206 RepID=UPI0024A52A24|nr:UvrD-helicase domain-containing protein [Actinokineospora sp. NBRC 105648]GLZ36870.1 DNA helicase [Actinokineospora sp. NBRC 105648]
MGLSAHALREVHRAAAAVVAREFSGLAPDRRRVLTALTAWTAQGWHLFVRDEPAAGHPDLFLVGRAGVFAAVIADGGPEETEARTLVRRAEERFADIRGRRGQVVTRSAVHLVAIRPGSAGTATAGHLFSTVGEAALDPRAFGAGHLPRDLVDTIADQVARRLGGHRRPSVPRPDRAGAQDGLLTVDDVAAEDLAGALARPFGTWLTFLHPHQLAVVKRHYNGPARISGPAGTGKTVVALHRMRHLARRTTGPLLFTTFVATLPAVHGTTFDILAPELAGRVEFTNLHAWVRAFLAGRGHDGGVERGAVGTQFNLAWKLHRSALADLDPDVAYWRTEVDRVIKGRGVDTLQEYLAVSRRGRTLRLDPARRTRVWELFQTYQDNLAAKGLQDHNDVVRRALAEVTTRGPDVPYAAVVADEVQDITLVGLRLLRALAGDGPNGLLLLGDGQQQVYAGGWRLSEAGIPIQGRGEVLRVNYRNGDAILDFARRLDATNLVDDLDGATGVTLAQAESANPGGRREFWLGPDADLPAALLSALRGLPVPLGECALIVFHRRELERCQAILRSAGIGYQALENYTGEPGEVLKIGTVHRSKGLEFRAVVVVGQAERRTTGHGSDQEHDELRARQHLVAATRARDYLWWGAVDSP